jgi:hypothetical protein
LIAQKATTQFVVALAFIHNAHIEPPLQWYAYEVGDPSAWRFLKQIDYEETAPQITLPSRRIKLQLTERFFKVYGIGSGHPKDLELEDFKTVSRSMAMYGWVLESWSISLAARAAQYLYMTVEPLSNIALCDYAISKGMTKDALLEPFLVEAKAREVTIPKEATEEERACMMNMYARTGAPGYKGQASGSLRNAALAHMVFNEATDVLRALKNAVDGLEHGHKSFAEVGLSVVPHMDVAINCVRRWIMRKLIVDDELFREWTSGDLDVPLINERCALMCKAEILSPKVYLEYDPNVPPFRMWVTPGPEFPGNLNVQSLLDPSVAIRNLGHGFGQVPSTISATAERRQQTLKVLFRDEQ